MNKQRLIYQLALASAVAMGATAAVLPASASANGLASLFGQSQPKFLPVHEAFQVSGSQSGDIITVHFTVTPKHYLYQDRILLKLPEGVTADAWQFDKTPSMVDDPTFGRVAVFEEDVVASARLTSEHPINDTVSVRWQGCAKAGLCYPPETTQIHINLTGGDNGAAASVAATSDNQPDAANISSSQAAAHDADTLSHPTAAVDSVAASPAIYTLDHTLPTQQANNKSALAMIALLFLAGLLLAFTPCVYPMLPIVANIVARQDAKQNHANTPIKKSAQRGFMLSGSYGLGVASAYGLLGALIAWFGQALGISAWFQRPSVLLAVAALFVLFALMMADIVRVQLPAFISRTLSEKSRLADDKLGSFGGSYLAGLLSALVVSPCVSAPMAGALTLVAASNSVAFGFIAMFMLGLGLSLPLIAMGTAQARWLPKSGAWMQGVREFGALLLLGVAILLANRVWLGSAMLIVWAAWFMLVALWLWRLGGQRALRYLALLPVAWALMLGVGAWAGSSDAWRPLAAVTKKDTHPQAFTDIHTTKLNELDAVLARQPKVLVDLTADWCIECRIMERTLFNQRSETLAKDWQVVKLDISESTDDSRAILSRYQLFGPPALLVYREGKLDEILLGETKPDALEAALAATH